MILSESLLTPKNLFLNELPDDEEEERKRERKFESENKGYTENAIMTRKFVQYTAD